MNFSKKMSDVHVLYSEHERFHSKAVVQPGQFPIPTCLEDHNQKLCLQVILTA